MDEPNLRVFIYCYTIGKEELCISLAEKFKTKIVLDADRYWMITKVKYHPNCFTNKIEEGFIHLTKGVNWIEKDVDQVGTIHINLTGWINCKDYINIKKREYLVSYSSHSNFKELEWFVSLVRPGVLNKIVIEWENLITMGKVKSLQSYFVWLKNLKQRGFQMLVEKYVDVNNISAEYMKFFDI